MIKKKLFYIIPEKWEKIYLYASVIDLPKQKPVGEMYFYYLPKGIIKKNTASRKKSNLAKKLNIM